jgi:hypothetical protein
MAGLRLQVPVEFPRFPPPRDLNRTYMRSITGKGREPGVGG